MEYFWKSASRHTTRKILNSILIPCSGNVHIICYSNFYVIFLQCITIVLSISRLIFYGFAGWTVHFDVGGFLWRELLRLRLRNNWNYWSGMGLRYVNLHTVKYTNCECNVSQLFLLRYDYWKYAFAIQQIIILVYKENSPKIFSVTSSSVSEWEL